MRALDPVPLVRCRLDGAPGAATTLRYVPLAEFELWRHFMETKHGRRVTIEAISVWLPEEPSVWNSGFTPDELEPVLRVRLEKRGPHGVPIPVERYFPAETYPLAQERLLAHIADPEERHSLVATPGYFVPEPARRRQTASLSH
jgi:hypothetical protein